MTMHDLMTVGYWDLWRGNCFASSLSFCTVSIFQPVHASSGIDFARPQSFRRRFTTSSLQRGFSLTKLHVSERGAMLGPSSAQYLCCCFQECLFGDDAHFLPKTSATSGNLFVRSLKFSHRPMVAAFPVARAVHVKAETWGCPGGEKTHWFEGRVSCAPTFFFYIKQQFVLTPRAWERKVPVTAHDSWSLMHIYAEGHWWYWCCSRFTSLQLFGLRKLWRTMLFHWYFEIWGFKDMHICQSTQNQGVLYAYILTAFHLESVMQLCK